MSPILPESWLDTKIVVRLGYQTYGEYDSVMVLRKVNEAGIMVTTRACDNLFISWGGILCVHQAIPDGGS